MQNTSFSSVPDDDDIVLPVLKYGYRETPFSWEELETIIQNVDLERLTRTKSQQREYERFKREIPQTWCSTLDYILVNKFGVERIVHTNNRLAAGRRETAQRTVVLVPNDFPYALPSTIQHWILWKLDSRITDQDVEQAREQLQPVAAKFLQWTNPPHLQSLPDIDHVHILVLLLKTNSNPQET